MSDPRNDYNRSESALAAQAEYGIGALWGDVAFLVRWGTADEINKRGIELGSLAYWWAGTGPHIQPKDLEALKALEKASERLAELYQTAEEVERRLHDRGYEFDPDTRRVKKMKGEGDRGPKMDLVSEWAGRVFDLLVEKQGWERRNTKAMRTEIRKRLADKIHPDHLGTEKGAIIHSAVNARLNPDRHY